MMDQYNEYDTDDKKGSAIDTAMESLEAMGIEVEKPNDMSEGQFEGIIGSEIDDAIDYIDNNISQDRNLATQYYRGEPFGDEEEGRSSVISMDVRDTVQSILPSLMKVFTSSEKVVEFVPNGTEDVEHAEQATDYINHVFMQENQGFKILYEAFKDALVRKAGVIKFYWDESIEVSTENYTELSQPALMLLLQDEDVEASAVKERLVGEPVMVSPEVRDPMTGELLQEAIFDQPKVFDLELKRRTSRGKIKCEALPPEEFLIDRRAKSIHDATMVAHRKMATVSELVALGYDFDTVMEHAGEDFQFDTNSEYYNRNPVATLKNYVAKDDANKRVLYIEAYVRADYDGDGIAELRRVCCIGDAHKIIRHEPWDHIPFAAFCPDPEPHTFFGQSLADITMDIQRIKSAILRNQLDSLAQAIHPRMAVVEGQANLEDVLNSEVGGIIRMRAPNMVQSFSQPFVGQQAFPMMAYMDEVKQSRTGINRAASGLDADALQSTTRTAVAATVTAARQHIELIARIFAETGMSDLFKGLLKLSILHQDEPRMVRLRNQFTQVDPRAWQAGFDVTVNVALGGVDDEQKMMLLQSVAERQENIISQFGLENPLVTLSQYRNTVGKILETAGMKDVDNYFLDPNGPQAQQIVMAASQKPKTPRPEEVLAQAEIAKTQAETQARIAGMQLEREKMFMEDERKRDELDAKISMDALELQAKYGTQIDIAQLRAEVEREKLSIRERGATLRQMMNNAPRGD
jgi:uncharacterized small protein (DUF1192 family)